MGQIIEDGIYLSRFFFIHRRDYDSVAAVGEGLTLDMDNMIRSKNRAIIGAN